MRRRYKVLSFLVLLIAIIGRRNEVVAMAKLLSSINDKDEGIVPGLPMWVVVLMILTATALVLAFLWSSALRAWFFRLFAGARPPTTNNIHNYSEVQLAGVDRSQQSSTMVALLVETGVATQMPAVASSSGGSGRGKGRGSRGRKGPPVRPSSASSAVVSTHVNSPQGGSTTRSDIHGSSTVHSKIASSGSSTRQQQQQQQQQQRRRASSQKQQETHPIQEPTTEFSTKESADGRKQKKKKRQGVASGGCRGEGEGEEEDTPTNL